MEPGLDYEYKKIKRVNNDANLIYNESDLSYIEFANLLIYVNGTFFDSANEVFANDEISPFVLDKKRQLMDDSTIENICDQIEAEINLYKQKQ